MVPQRGMLDDITQVCSYLFTKPTGATQKDIVAVLGSKFSDARKLYALKFWGLIEEEDGRFKVNDAGRRYAKSDDNARASILGKILKTIPVYFSVIERVASRGEESLSATEVAAHWHEHYKDEVSENETILNEQAVCYFQFVSGTNLGTLIIGRRGAPTRFDFDLAKVRTFIGATELICETDQVESKTSDASVPPPASGAPASTPPSPSLGQAIFVAHGKNKKPLEQLKTILDGFKIPYKVAIEEPNLGRPISAKVKEIMDSCNCAILIFTADEEFNDKGGNTVWRPSQNVVYEFGAAGYLYGKRLVVIKEDCVVFPSDFRDIGYIEFQKDKLSEKAMDIIKELLGMGLLKFST